MSDPTEPTCPKRHWAAGACQRPAGHEGNHQAWLGRTVVGWTNAQCSTGRVTVCEYVV